MAKLPMKMDQATIAKALPYITAAVGLAYALVFYAFGIAPKISRLRQGGEFDITPFTQRLESEKEYAEKIDAATKKLSSVDAAIRQQVQGAIPSSPDIPGIYVQLDALTRENQFQLKSIDAVPDPLTEASGGRKVVRISMNVVGGDYASFKKLIADIERSQRVFDVRSISFSAGSGSYSLIVRAYYVDAAAIADPPVIVERGITEQP